MNNVVSLDSYRENIVVQTESGVEVCPVLMFKNIVNGKIKLGDIPDNEELIKAIIKDWLEYVCI